MALLWIGGDLSRKAGRCRPRGSILASLVRSGDGVSIMARARLRDLGITVGALPTGLLNAITDIEGVRVGYATLIRDTPSVVRTGVTAIWPRGKEIWTDYVFAGWHSFNGNGEMTDLPWIAEQGYVGAPTCIPTTDSGPAHRAAPEAASPAQDGSIIVILATDAPLRPIQCQRLARRATTGLAWVGGIGANGSGDIFLAFSTANHIGQSDKITTVRMLAADAMTSLFRAAAEATEEAILNAMTAAETMTGQRGRTIHALPLGRLQTTMQRYTPAPHRHAKRG